MDTYESENFNLRLVGLSRDLRTNVWEVTCKKCKKSHKPSTTMFADQQIICPKCNNSEFVNYNNL